MAVVQLCRTPAGAGSCLQTHLSSDGDVFLVFIPRSAVCWVIVVEHNADSGLGDACTALLVHKLLQVLGTHLLTAAKTR